MGQQILVAFRSASVCISAGVLGSTGVCAVDWTPAGAGASPRSSLAALGVAAVAGTVLGAATALLVLADHWIVRSTTARWPRASWLGAAPYVAAIAIALDALALTPGHVARLTSHGARAAAWLAFWALIVVGAAATRRSFALVLGTASARLSRAATAPSTALLTVGATLMWLYRTDKLGVLHARLDPALAGLALVTWMAALAIVLTVASERLRHAGRAVQVFASLGTLWCGLAFGVPGLLTRLEESVRAPRTAPTTYVGRVASLAKSVRASGARGLFAGDSARIMVDRYDLRDTTLRDEWADAVPGRSRLQAAPGNRRPLSVIVFFIDALRSDAALDPNLMPNLSAFAAGALVFTRAYAAGSDTLRTLPALLSCRYDADLQKPAPMLTSARRHGLTTALFIPDSPNHFLHTLYPGFAFDVTHTVADHDPARGRVWAYGADRPTADRLVDRALEWITAVPREPFLAWLYNYDVHNWADLDAVYIDEVVAKAGLSRDGGLPLRYRAAARGVDGAFGRLVAGLTERGLIDSTAILVLSDHGEGLAPGLWMHTTHLWEALVRIPLILKSPGGATGRIDDPVSVVDVFPGLHRLVGEPEGPCHGEDLLSLAQRPRARPIVFSAVTDGALARIGIVAGERKLVLPVRDGDAELFDLGADEPDRESIAGREPAVVERLRAALVRSPVFPRGR